MGSQLRYGGVSQYFNPDGTVVEKGTRTCGHCQQPVEFDSARQILDKMDFCRGCMRLICVHRCYPEYVARGCSPAIKRIEDAEERAYRNAQFHRAMGFA